MKVQQDWERVCPERGVQEDERENIGLDVANPSSSTKIYDNFGCCLPLLENNDQRSRFKY